MSLYCGGAGGTMQTRRQTVESEYFVANLLEAVVAHSPGIEDMTDKE
jgi:hypothetical protein